MSHNNLIEEAAEYFGEVYPFNEDQSIVVERDTQIYEVWADSRPQGVDSSVYEYVCNCEEFDTYLSERTEPLTDFNN